MSTGRADSLVVMNKKNAWDISSVLRDSLSKLKRESSSYRDGQAVHAKWRRGGYLLGGF